MTTRAAVTDALREAREAWPQRASLAAVAFALAAFAPLVTTAGLLAAVLPVAVTLHSNDSAAVATLASLLSGAIGIAAIVWAARRAARGAGPRIAASPSGAATTPAAANR